MADTITLQFLTLATIKAQLRIESEYTEEDEYLTSLGKVAERKVFKDTCRTYDEIVAMENDEWPIDLTHAALLLVGEWYKHREPDESVQMHDIPYGYEALYMPYRKGTYSSVEEN